MTPDHHGGASFTHLGDGTPCTARPTSGHGHRGSSGQLSADPPEPAQRSVAGDRRRLVCPTAAAPDPCPGGPPALRARPARVRRRARAGEGERSGSRYPRRPEGGCRRPDRARCRTRRRCRARPRPAAAAPAPASPAPAPAASSRVGEVPVFLLGIGDPTGGILSRALQAGLDAPSTAPSCDGVTGAGELLAQVLGKVLDPLIDLIVGGDAPWVDLLTDALQHRRLRRCAPGRHHRARPGRGSGHLPTTRSWWGAHRDRPRWHRRPRRDGDGHPDVDHVRHVRVLGGPARVGDPAREIEAFVLLPECPLPGRFVPVGYDARTFVDAGVVRGSRQAVQTPQEDQTVLDLEMSADGGQEPSRCSAAPSMASPRFELGRCTAR